MRLIVDANVVVVELLRRRGQDLVTHPQLELFIAEHAWSEAQHEVVRRVNAMVQHSHLTISRIPRDPDDWPTVAVAILLGAGICTYDGDFLGCGCPTWTTETLVAELARLPRRTRRVVLGRGLSGRSRRQRSCPLRSSLPGCSRNGGPLPAARRAPTRVSLRNARSLSSRGYG